MGSKGGLEYKKGFFDNEAAWLMPDIAITGVKPEMNIQSLKDIRADSPYAHNIMQNGKLVIPNARARQKS